MDILAALNDTNPQRGANRCKVQRILDDIPDETAGKAELVAAVDADKDTFPANRLTLTFSALGMPLGDGAICDHRAKRCFCYR